MTERANNIKIYCLPTFCAMSAQYPNKQDGTDKNRHIISRCVSNQWKGTMKSSVKYNLLIRNVKRTYKFFRINIFDYSSLPLAALVLCNDTSNYSRAITEYSSTGYCIDSPHKNARYIFYEKNIHFTK